MLSGFLSTNDLVVLTMGFPLGLVILEAWYGPAERDSDSEGLDLNVTISMQALVNKSQLYIPGRRSKVGLLPLCVFRGEKVLLLSFTTLSAVTNMRLCSRGLQTSIAENILCDRALL